MNTDKMWRLKNVLTGQEIFCATKPPMDNCFDGWSSKLWRLDPPREPSEDQE